MSKRNDATNVQISIRDIYKSYQGNDVLRGVTLDIIRGRRNIVIGGSGAGKTVLMRHLLGLERPDKGQILFEEKDLAQLDELQLSKVRQRFGMVFQHAALFDSMSVYDNVAFPLRERGQFTKKEIHEKVMDKLVALGVDDAADRFPGDISGGMKKRVGVARALVTEPDIIIYDEPTAGLDPLGARNVDRMILEMDERYSATSVVITHDMATCLDIGELVSMLHLGEIRITCQPAELLTNADPVVREFVEASGVVR